MSARCACRGRRAGLAVVRRRWSLQVAVFPHLAWEGIVPNLCLLVVVAAALVRGPAVRRHPRLRRRPAARPRPAGRPRRRPLGARARRRRLRRRAGCARTPGPTAVARGRHGRRLVVRRHVDLRAQPAACCGDPVVRRPATLLRVILVARAAGTCCSPRSCCRWLMRLFRRLEPRGSPDDLARPRRARRGRSDQSRLRLVVVQALVFSLFVTLFARLYYLQVRRRRRLPAPRPRRSRCARSSCSRSAA